jgi:hypothetical protein
MVAAWLALGITLCLAFISEAAVDLGSDGVGYTPTVIPPSGMDVSYLSGMISFFNTGNPTSITLGSGHNQASYSFTKSQGSLTPNTLPSASSPPFKLNSEVTSFTGQGTPSATINLGSGGFDYLIAQWDGPGGVDAVYYVHGLTGVITLDNKDPVFGTGNGNSAFGLSGFWLGGDSTLPTNPTQNVIPVPETNFGFASALAAIPFFGWSFLRWRRKQNVISARPHEPLSKGRVSCHFHNK